MYVLTFFRAPEKKDFPFFPVGRPRPEPKTNPCRVAFSLRERADLRSQKEGIWGKKIAWGRVGRTGQKKGKKDAQKQIHVCVSSCLFCDKLLRKVRGMSI